MAIPGHPTGRSASLLCKSGNGKLSQCRSVYAKTFLKKERVILSDTKISSSVPAVVLSLLEGMAFLL